MITKRKRSYQTVFFSIFLILLAIGVIVFFVFTNWRINQKRAEFHQKIEALKKEIQILEEKNAALRAGISQTESEEYQTKRLYEQGYFEEGTIPVVVLPFEKEVVKEEEEKNPWNPQNWWTHLLRWVPRLKSKVRD